MESASDRTVDIEEVYAHLSIEVEDEEGGLILEEAANGSNDRFQLLFSRKIPH